jgi:putative transposase
VNRKRVERLWRLHGPQVPQHAIKRGRAGRGEDGSERYRAECAHDVWAVDILHDATADGRRLRILTVSDEASKACLAVTVGRSLTASDVSSTLERLMSVYGPPARVRSDNGPELVARAVRSHLAATGVNSMFIEPGAPWQNPSAETFHARLRDELLDHEVFSTVFEAGVLIEAWRRAYNERMPHGALCMATPAEALRRLTRPPA